VTEKAYGEPLLAAGYDVRPVYVPFVPLTVTRAVKRDTKRLVWLPQWKNIKGIHKFFRGVPELVKAGFNVGLYNNGIEYYKLRLTEEWKKTVDWDHFVGEGGTRTVPAGPVQFWGCLPLESMPEVLLGAAFMADFQGHSAKHAAYLNGSYNSTIVEALYYGTVPVVHSNMLKSDIPSELLLAVDKIEDYPEAVRKFRLKDYDRRWAREYVEDSHNADRLYATVLGGLGKAVGRGSKR
jgi:predicted transcriptional regulator with HTH domain